MGTLLTSVVAAYPRIVSCRIGAMKTIAEQGRILPQLQQLFPDEIHDSAHGQTFLSPDARALRHSRAFAKRTDARPSIATR